MVKTWMIKPFPHHIDRFSDFKSDNIIAIGWPKIPSLLGKNKKQLKEILKNYHKDYSPSQLGMALATVNIFVNGMSLEDFVVIPYKSDIYFAKVTSDYFFDPNKISDGYPHQRKIEWLKGPVPRKQLPGDLRNLFIPPKAAANLSQYTDLVTKLAHGDLSELSQSTPNYVDVSYPLRTNLDCTIRIPNDITKEESERLAEFIKTLYLK